MGWDTTPPESHGCPWLALIGPFPCRKGQIDLHSFVEVMELREEGRRELMIIQIFESMDDFKFTVLTVLHPSCEHY